MGKFTKVMQIENTRVDCSEQTEARLDRVYMSMPGWMFNQLIVRAWLDETAQQTHAEKLRDHAMLQLQVCAKERSPGNRRPIRADGFKDP
eukprot:3910675-Karenia_brevis.AAC.1